MTRKFLPIEPAQKDIERFWSYVDVQGPNNCWEWTGSRQRSGHGNIYLKGKVIKVHRLAYTIANGPIPDGLCVIHSCDNPPCCNDAHLSAETQGRNILDAYKRGLQPRYRGRRGEQVPSHKLTVAQVTDIRTLYVNGTFNQYELAEKFGVLQSNISQIIQLKTWKHVDAPPDYSTDQLRNISKENHRISLQGELSSSAKLTATDVRDIRALQGSMSQLAISKIYKVSQSTIWLILSRKTWKHI